MDPDEQHSMDSDWLPRTLRGGRYALTSRLGEGGMAVVFRARDTELDVVRAVKILLPGGNAREGLRRRLRSEARAMAQLRHPNVLQIHDVGTDGELDYVVMDLAPGGSLADLLAQGRALPAASAIRCVVQVLSALAAAHARGIVHRDVKPHNILLDESGKALLADFGIALLLEDDRSTRTGVAMGSMAFMPPEQRLDAARVGPAADLYAAGATLYNLVTGGNPVDLFLAPEDSPRWARVPDALLPILRRACASRVQDRYPHAGAMARELARALVEVGAAPAPARTPEELYPAPSAAFTDRSGQGRPVLPASFTSSGLDSATREALTFLIDGTPPAVPTRERVTAQTLLPPLPPEPLELHPVPVAHPEPRAPQAVEVSARRRALAALLVVLALWLVGLGAWQLWREGMAEPAAVAEVVDAAPEPDLSLAPAEVPGVPEPEPEPEPSVAIAAPVVAAPKPVAPRPRPRPAGPVGGWSGHVFAASGVTSSVTLELDGTPAEVRGTLTSRFRGNQVKYALSGAYDEGSRRLSLADEEGAVTYTLDLASDGQALSGRAERAGAAPSTLTLSRDAL